MLSPELTEEMDLEVTEPNHQQSSLLRGDPERSGSEVLTRTAKILQECRIYWTSYRAMEFIFCLFLFSAGLIIELLTIKPRQRIIPFQLSRSTGEYIINQVYGETIEDETISDGGLILLGVLLPFLFQMALGYFSVNFNSHRTACVYLSGVGLTVLITNAIKFYVGYLRPIFYEVCVPDDKYETCTSGEDDNARQSFPSGHSSLSFCGLGLFSCYLEQRFGVSRMGETLAQQNSSVPSSEMDHRSDQVSERSIVLARLSSILARSPLLLAGFIATSRIVDNHHFPADVVGGSILGFSIALWISGMYNYV